MNRHPRELAALMYAAAFGVNSSWEAQRPHAQEQWIRAADAAIDYCAETTEEATGSVAVEANVEENGHLPQAAQTAIGEEDALSKEPVVQELIEEGEEVLEEH